MIKETIGIDLFGQPILKDPLLRDKFIEPPFSVLNTRSVSWQNRKRKWLNIGIKSEIGRLDNLTYSGEVKNLDYYRIKEKGILKSEQGRKENLTHIMLMGKYNPNKMREEYYDKGKEIGTSIFCPALTELMYYWFCPKNGYILDPFAGGSVRGIVAHYLDYHYLGIELRLEQVESNIEQGKLICPLSPPQWICGDSEKELDNIKQKFDLIFSCPPYVNLEIYSELPEDLSNMEYKDFIIKYTSIIRKSVNLLKKNCFAVFVVGEVRDKDGYYYNFVGDTKRIFIEAGLKFYNDAILLNVVGSASMRADRIFGSNKKLVKIHQNILIFKK